jgi:hypothetical protein
MDRAGGLNRALKTSPGAPEPARDPADGPIREALSAIESALFAIDTIRLTIEQAYEVVQSARDAPDDGARALFAESYDELRLSLNKLIDDLDPQAASLIGKSAHNLDVKLGGKAHYSISAARLDISTKGLNLDPPREAFATSEEVERVNAELDAALARADRIAGAYCRDAQFLMARLPKDETSPVAESTP